MIACEWKREVERSNWATYQQLASLSQNANQKKLLLQTKWEHSGLVMVPWDLFSR